MSTKPIETLPVLFRMQQGKVTAYLPTCEANPGRIMCYAHIGQHCEADLRYYRTGRPATLAEYVSLLQELRGIYERPRQGDVTEYRLQVRKRLPAYA